MKSVMMFLVAVLVSVSMSAANPEWYALYKMTSTASRHLNNAISKTHTSGYLMIGISVYADTIRAEAGNVLKFTKGEGKVYTCKTTSLVFDIQNSPPEPRWIGSSLVTSTGGEFVRKAVEGIVGDDYRLMSVCHCVPQTGPVFQLSWEIVPLTLEGNSVSVVPHGVEAIKSAYRFDLAATQAVNHQYKYVDGAFQLIPPASLDDAVAAFALYLQQHGGSLAE